MNQIYRENLEYIRSADAKAAYARLFELAHQLELEISFNENATPKTMKLYGTVQGIRIFILSADRARHHFTFYIRKPATDAWSGLIAAGAKLGGCKKGKQVQFRVEKQADIERIWALVAPKIEEHI